MLCIFIWSFLLPADVQNLQETAGRRKSEMTSLRRHHLSRHPPSVGREPHHPSWRTIAGERRSLSERTPLPSFSAWTSTFRSPVWCRRSCPWTPEFQWSLYTWWTLLWSAAGVCSQYTWWTLSWSAAGVCSLYAWWTLSWSAAGVCSQYTWWTLSWSAAGVCSQYAWWTLSWSAAGVCSQQLSSQSRRSMWITRQPNISRLLAAPPVWWWTMNTHITSDTNQLTLDILVFVNQWQCRSMWIMMQPNISRLLATPDVWWQTVDTYITSDMNQLTFDILVLVNHGQFDAWTFELWTICCSNFNTGALFSNYCENLRIKIVISENKVLI